MILDDHAAEAAKEYNQTEGRYNRVADAVYRCREVMDPFSSEYEPHIVRGLTGFKMGRRMGKDFRGRLRLKLSAARNHLEAVPLVCLDQVDLNAIEARASAAYTCLASPGPGSLDAKEEHFHVGATKILHWIAPGLFIILDSNVAAAFRENHPEIGFKATTQPGYSAARYVQCLKLAKEEIRAYGYDRFRLLEPQTPLARLFDKVAFIVGGELQRKRE